MNKETLKNDKKIPLDLFTKVFEERLEALHFLNTVIAQEINNSSIFLFHTKQNFSEKVIKTMANNCYYKLVTDSGVTRYIRAIDDWLKWEDRRKINAYCFNNTEPYNNGTANLFSGFEVKPVQNEQAVNHTIDVLTKIICSGKVEQAQALIRILAWEAQNIGKPSRVIKLIKSNNQQTGKGSFFDDFMGQQIYGKSAYITNELQKVVGRFNSHLKGITYVLLDETGFSGNKVSANTLKNLSTTTSIRFEQKGLDIGLPTPVAFNIIALTNHETGAHIEDGDGRYFYIDMKDMQKDSPEILEWNRVNGNENKGVDNTYASAWLYYLLNLPLPKEYRPTQDLIYSDKKEDMILKGEPHSFAAYMDNIDNIIPYEATYLYNGKVYLKTHTIIELYHEWLGKYNKFGDSKTKIGLYLNKKLFGKGINIKINNIQRTCREIPSDFQIQPDPKIELIDGLEYNAETNTIQNK